MTQTQPTQNHKSAATPQHLHALYTSTCDTLQIPHQATNKLLQQQATSIYQDIWSYADHFLAVLRCVTLAKWAPNRSAGEPLHQLLQRVANGGTLQDSHTNKDPNGITEMELAICLAHLADQTDEPEKQQCSLASHYIDYIYRLRQLQQLHRTPLYLSQRRHCGQNRHAT